jgi:hypothetical protein
MKFKLEIDMGNAAFDTSEEGNDACNGIEVARILRDLAKQVDSGVNLESGMGRKVYDYNGNKVGGWEVTE